MSGTALDHPLIRDYLRELDGAFAGSPAGQARELREQLTAHSPAQSPEAGARGRVAALLDPRKVQSGNWAPACRPDTANGAGSGGSFRQRAGSGGGGKYGAPQFS